MKKKVALITGAGSGIGRAVAMRLADAGFAVVVAGRRQALLDEVSRGAGADALAVCADVCNAQSVERLFAQVQEKHGRLDVLFNNAGIGAKPTPIEDLPLETWRAVIDTNLTGAFLCTQAAIRMMKAQQPRGGRIINNGSIAAYVPRPHMAAYTASKHAISGLTKSTALEGRPHDIACGQIDIGNVATELAATMINGTLQADMTLKTEPTFEVRHVADAVLYMAQLPLTANVLSMTVMATAMPFVGRG